MIRTTPLLLTICILCALFASQALADFYQYADGSGAVHMTNKLDAVPQKYRSTMKVVREEPAQKKEVRPEAPQPEPVSVVPASQEVVPTNLAAKFDTLGSRFPWFKPVVYVFVIAALFALITKVTPLLPSRLLGKVVYFAFMAGVLLFLYKSYSAHVVDSAHKLKEDAEAVARKAQERQPQTVTTGEAVK